MKSNATFMLLKASCILASAFAGAEPARAETSSLASQFRPIEFTSRAQCAISSASPARSILIVGDGLDAGRLAFNLKTKAGIVVTEADTMAAYRKSVGFTFKLVIEKLLDGSLPLLSGPTADPSLAALMAKCHSKADPAQGQRGCAPLEAKLAQLWTFALQPAASLPIRPSRVGCHKISSFTALHGHLNKSRPAISDLEEIASVLVENGRGPIACDAESNQSDRHFLLQLDLLTVDEKTFEKQGFDFWTSAKTYAAWAWRKAPDVEFQMGRFGALFPNLALEEELLLVPNGCRSVSLPQCELQRLSLDSLRELAKPPGAVSGFERRLPTGPQDDLITRGVRSVNNGFLGTQAEDAQAWVKNFSTRLNDARWVSRNKLQAAIRHGRVLEKLSNDDLLKDLEADIRMYNPETSATHASQLAAVCLEARLIENPSLRILRPDFNAVIAAGGDLTMDSDSSRSALSLVAVNAQDLAKRLQPLCDSLAKSLFITRAKDKAEATTFDWRYLGEWARERMTPLVTAETTPLNADEKRRGWLRPEAYLKLKSPTSPSTGTASDTRSEIEICRSPLACAQLTFKSYVDLYYVSTWAAAMQNARHLKDSNLFNPYAELTACKIYDPWYTSERANADLTQRLVVSAISAALPVPVFFESSEKRPRTVAMKNRTGRGDGELRFTPQYASEDSKKTFFADLGPLTGAPCAIQYANESGAPFQVYGLSGVTLNYCSDGKSGIADTADDGVTTGKSVQRSICGGCTINATSAVSAASYAAPPGPLRFLFGAMRAFGLYNNAVKDEVNRPITYTVDPVFVADAYRENGKQIPESCKDSLSQGFRCHDDPCAAKVAQVFEQRSGIRASVSSIRYDDEDAPLGGVGQRSGLAGIRIPQCDSEILAQVRCDSSKRQYDVLGEFSAFSKSCRAIIDQMKPAAR